MEIEYLKSAVTLGFFLLYPIGHRSGLSNEMIFSFVAQGTAKLREVNVEGHKNLQIPGEAGTNLLNIT